MWPTSVVRVSSVSNRIGVGVAKLSPFTDVMRCANGYLAAIAAGSLAAYALGAYIFLLTASLMNPDPVDDGWRAV
jgi:hypothetical protein